jgi:hypothetical protein
MKMARVLLLAAVAAVAGTSLPGLVWSQAPTPDTIDVARPDAVAGRRFTMHQRVRVVVQNLNPFAGNYRVVVNEKAYSDSAISNFLAGLGITVPAAAPQPKGVAAASLSAAVAQASIMGLLPREGLLTPRCDGSCAGIERAARTVVERYYALQDTLHALDTTDVRVRSQLLTVTSEQSDSKSVMAALDSVIHVLQDRVDRLHSGQTYLQAAAAITSDAVAQRPRLDACPCAESVRIALDSIIAQQRILSIRASWRDTLQTHAQKDLPALTVAKSQASKIFVHVFEVGDYDYPTTVDIAIQRQPLGPLSFAALVGQVGETTGSGTPAVTPPAPPLRPTSSHRAERRARFRLRARDEHVRYSLL